MQQKLCLPHALPEDDTVHDRESNLRHCDLDSNFSRCLNFQRLVLKKTQTDCVKTED